MLTEAAIKRIKQLQRRYPKRESALLPALWVAQREEGHLSPESVEAIAGLFGITPVQVTSTASFYSMYALRPRGQYVIQVCRSISCSLMGAESVTKYLSEQLGIGVGETTEDGRYTLLEVECLASCGTAPMMQINDDYHESLTPEKVDKILEGLR